MGSGLLSSVAPYVQSSFEASLIPAIDSLRSLAIVAILARGPQQDVRDRQ
jgi:ABC-type iron transport system FetAB permease component